LRRVVDVLLGSVWVVKDRDSARRWLERLHQEDEDLWRYNARVVTLQGEVFYAAGPILAGSSGEATISRPRQMRELRMQLEKLERQLAELDSQIRQFESSRNQAREEEAQKSQELKRAQAQEERLHSAHSQGDLAVEKTQRQLQFRREEQSRLEDEMKRSSEESAGISAQVTSLDMQIGQARKKLNGFSERLAGLPLEELQTSQAYWNTRAAVAERAEMEATRRLAERQAALDTVIRTLHSLQSRLVDLEASLEKLESEKGNLRKEEGRVGDELEALRILIEPAEAQLEAYEGEQAGLQTLEATARQSMSLAEHHHAQARILLARRQEALDSLHRRIEDDFGLVAFEYVEEISGQATLPLDGMVEQLPVIHDLSSEIEETIKRQRAQLRRMGPVNPEAQAEYQQVKERFDFLNVQVADLNTAETDVRQVIAELDQLMQREFRKTFDAVAAEFVQIFTRLFGGGTARLLLTDPDDLTGTGIEIEARLPGRRTQGLSLLSGGERSLTATALIFALLKVSPTPFCVLDEVDAMLDETNVGRFRDLLRELSQNTQFVVVTHNRNTVQVADIIYGVTMGRDSATQVLSLKLDELGKVVEQETG
jgi:chromosome segregation protein